MPTTQKADRRTARRARHIHDNYYIGAAINRQQLEIWAYSDRLSYQPGDTVRLHVSSNGETWSVCVRRDDVSSTPVHQQNNLICEHLETPHDCSINGCDWPVTHEFMVGCEWPSGVYLVTLTTWRQQETVEEHHLIVVRRAADKPASSMLLLCATPTWVAYNCWGGSNAYEGLCGPGGDQFSPRLSLQRPWTRGFCKLPPGAPRAIPEQPPAPGTMVRYPYMEWAYAYGFSKKYASAGWASYEKHFADWAERQGYTLDYATLHDLDGEADLLNDYQCVVLVGHDEYWSTNMRNHIDSWVESGGRVARFAGNFMWQVRMENEGQTQVCYKYISATEDPLVNTSEQHLVTGCWESPEVNRPGSLTFGANASRGIYAGLGLCAGRGAGGYTIYRPDHWSLADTGLGYGDLLGSQSRIFGYEVDGLDYRIDNGLPEPTGSDSADASISIVGLGLASNVETNQGLWAEEYYLGDHDAHWIAEQVFGGASAENLDRAGRGNGVMIHWQRKAGEVFNAATCEWVMGLSRNDAQVEQVTRNVLNRFIGDC